MTQVATVARVALKRLQLVTPCCCYATFSTFEVAGLGDSLTIRRRAKKAFADAVILGTSVS